MILPSWPKSVADHVMAAVVSARPHCQCQEPYEHALAAQLASAETLSTDVLQLPLTGNEGLLATIAITISLLTSVGLHMIRSRDKSSLLFRGIVCEACERHGPHERVAGPEASGVLRRRCEAAIPWCRRALGA